MAKTKISEFSTTAGNNTDINSINIAEGCAPSGINDAIRELMRQLKEFQTGGAGDSVNSGGDFSVATNKFTVASASGNTAVAGTLAVTGTTTLTGALVANGNATLGDGSGDTVTVKGTPTLEVNPTLSGGTANGVLYLNGSKVATSGSALVFDGSNLGLGVTPSAWNLSGLAALQVKNSSLAGYLSNTYLSANTYYSGGWKYVSTDYASQYQQISGGHQWFTAPSGTAGNAITFTQAMTLDASGNLLVGTTSPLVNAGGRGNITVNGSTDAVLAFGIGAATAGYLYQGPSALIVNTQGARAITFENNGTERARIDSSGNLLVGKTSAGVGVDGAQILPSGYSGFSAAGTTALFLNRNTNDGTIVEFGRNGVSAATMGLSSSALTFGTGGSERARIDSSGNFIHQVNGTAPSLSTNSTMSFELTSNTSLKIVVRGTDGTTRSATLVLV